jgi:hypothetical protein
MNTTRTHSFAALSAAAFLTLAMLLGVNTLATSEVPAQQLAQATAPSA